MTTVEARPSAVQETQEEIRELAAPELRLWHEIRARRQELDSPSVGHSTLAQYMNGEGQTAISRVAHLRASIEALEIALEAARQSRKEAVRALYLGQAAKARQRATQLMAQAEELDRKSAPHLEALKELMGVNFVPFAPPDRRFDHALFRSKSQKLKDEAQELETFARQREREQPQTSAIVLGENAAELVEKLLEHPLIIGPSIPDIYEWVGEQRRRGVRDPLVLRVHNGRID
jgi:hypothetical protein